MDRVSPRARRLAAWAVVSVVLTVMFAVIGSSGSGPRSSEPAVGIGGLDTGLTRAAVVDSMGAPCHVGAVPAGVGDVYPGATYDLWRLDGRYQLAVFSSARLAGSFGRGPTLIAAFESDAATRDPASCVTGLAANPFGRGPWSSAL
jgi:hypothetical protein